MKKEDIISFLITAAMGVFAGFYLYVVGFAPTANRLITLTQPTSNTFSITGEVYGGCRSACPSFQLLGSGAYRFLYTPAAGAESVIREGTLPLGQQTKLHQTLTPTALAQEAKEITPALCNSHSDGLDVRYEIVRDGTTYRLDSCGTAIDGEGAVWEVLGEVWTYFERAGS